MPGRPLGAQKGDTKRVTIVLWRAYGQLRSELYLSPGTAARKVVYLREQGYAHIQVVEVAVTLEI